MTMPDADVAVRLTGPDGDVWEWGESASATSVSGPALDFCLVVTQRRHRRRHPTCRSRAMPHASGWRIAQAFAGGVGAGRQPGQFAAHRSVMSLKTSAAA